MTTNQNSTNDQDAQVLAKQISDATDEAKAINQELASDSEKAMKMLDEIEAQVDESAGKIDQLALELDQVEKEAGAELDALAMRQAEDLAKE